MRNIKYTDSATFRCLEHLRESSLDLSLIHTGKEQCKSNHTLTGARQEYIIHFVLKGSGFYSSGGSTWSLSPGQMFLIYPGDPVIYGADHANPWMYAWIGFNGIRVDAILKQCGFSKNCLVRPAPPNEEILECIDSMLEKRTLTFANDLRREAGLLNLFALLCDYNASLSKQKIIPAKSGFSSSVYVELALDYIQGMYGHGINVTDIADNIGISRAQLNQAFQKVLGLSVQKFLIDYRMHKAANLLVSTGMSIKEISNTVGYDDQLTFSKAFKKKFEMSPKAYRTHVDVMDKFKEKQ